jgi:ribonucleoside-diphosphate reductase alpha chain
MSGKARLQEVKVSENALKVLEKRYLKKDKEGKIIETPQDMFRRVAHNIASADGLYKRSPEEVKKTEEAFYQLLASLDFLPNSPTLMNADTELQQLAACFVLSVDDSIESIYEAIKHTAVIHKSGGGTGFSFSRIRPKGSSVGTTSGVASGPVSFMKVFDASTEAIKQGGRRRGANMGILNVNHPDILEFVVCKRKEGNLRNFNISVAVIDEFMEAAQRAEDYDLMDPRTKKKVGRLNAAKVLDTIVEMAWKNGEPGLVFLDRINRDNPTPELGEIESTNPCGEQPLLPYESCNLGSINLSSMITDHRINWDKLRKTVYTSVHFLDNVIDVNKYPLPEIERNTKANRKIGLGVMGFADLLVKLNIPYDSKEGIGTAESIMKFIQKEAQEASQKLAEERGVFPNYQKSIYRKKGVKLRNATTTTIAPTGSISMIANCSSGIEPFFSLVYYKEVLGGEKLLYVNEEFEKIARQKKFYSPGLLRNIANNRGSCRRIAKVPPEVQDVFVISFDISSEDHIKMQAAFQKYTDSAVSKTVNFPTEAAQEDVKKSYLLAYRLGCKGITVYRDQSREEQVYSTGRPKEKDRLLPRPRAKVVSGITIETRTGCGDLYVTINEDERENPFEVFARLGKSGGCAASQTEAIGRLTSLCLRSGISWEQVAKQLKGITCDRSYGFGKGKILSCADAVAKAIELHQEPKKSKAGQKNPPPPLEKYPVSGKIESNMNSQGSTSRRGRWIGACPDCGSGTIEYEGGCFVCKSCGYTECS